MEQQLREHHLYLAELARHAEHTHMVEAVTGVQPSLADRALATLGMWMVATGSRLSNRLNALQRADLPTQPIIQKAN